MKRFLPLLFCVLSCGHVTAPVAAQDAIPLGVGGIYTKLPVVRTTGPLGSYISYAFEGVAPPSGHTVSWSITGSAPSACTFMVEGSSDAAHWFTISGDDNNPAVQDCSTPNSFSIVYKPYLFVRINIVTYTGATDGTTVVKFLYNRSIT